MIFMQRTREDRPDKSISVNRDLSVVCEAQFIDNQVMKMSFRQIIN